MDQTISINQIDQLRRNILANLKMMELNKPLFRSHDYLKLMNHHNFILETLDNMINIKKVEMNDPYNSWNATPSSRTVLDPSATRQQVIYNRDGTTRIVNVASLDATGEEWEKQFDQRFLLNPPCYMMPPQNLSGIPRIRNASEANRVRSLTHRSRNF